MSGLLNANAKRIPLADQSVHCCVTSPPYWGLRKYEGVEPSIWGGDAECEHVWDEHEHNPQPHGDDGSGGNLEGGRHAQQQTRMGAVRSGFCQRCGAWRGCLGLEPTPELYVEHITQIFREVKRVLRDDGTCWLVIGDSYASGGMSNPSTKSTLGGGKDLGASCYSILHRAPDLKPKDLVGIPWRVAFALQADGAASPETMRTVERIQAALLADFDSWEAVPDRTRQEIEQLQREWDDAHKGGWWLRSAIVWAKGNPMPESVKDRPTRSYENVFLLAKAKRYYYDADAIREPLTEWSVKALKGNWHRKKTIKHAPGSAQDTGGTLNRGNYGTYINPAGRNKRDVWHVNTRPYKGAHFATFPPDLIEPMILAGCPEGGIVLDPFVGSGTTVAEAIRLGRHGIGLDLSGTYLHELATERTAVVQPVLV